MGAEEPTLYRYDGSPAHLQALRQICGEWSGGDTGFWSFDDVCVALQRPQSLLLFVAAAAAASVWWGAILIDVAVDAADVLYIYVQPARRRQSCGELLLGGAIAELKRHAALDYLFLEVRAGNGAAIALYKGFGMLPVGVRKGYYRNGDSAVVYRLDLRTDACTI